MEAANVGEEALTEGRQNTALYNTIVPSMEHAGQGFEPLSACVEKVMVVSGAFPLCVCSNFRPSWLKTTLRMIRVEVIRYVFLWLTVANIPKTRLGVRPFKKTLHSIF